MLGVTAFIRFFSVDPATGTLLALSRNNLHNLIHLVLVVCALELYTYERRSRMKKFRRNQSIQVWRKDAQNIAEKEMAESAR